MRRYQKAFLAAWSVERVLDAATTWEAIRRGGFEANRMLRWLMGELGVEEALAVWTIAAIGLGLLLAVGIQRLFSRAAGSGRLTRIDRVLLEKYGPDGVAMIVLSIVLGIGAVGPLVNGFCLIMSSLR